MPLMALLEGVVVGRWSSSISSRVGIEITGRGRVSYIANLEKYAASSAGGEYDALAY